MNYQTQTYMMAKQTGHGLLQLLPLSALTLVHLSISRSHDDRLRTDLTELARLLDLPSGAAWGGLAFRAMGYTHLVLGELDEAAEAFQTGLTARNAFIHLGKPELLVGLAGVAIERGLLADAAEHLADARTYAAQAGLRLVMPLIALAEARLTFAQGDHQAALEGLERTEAEALGMGLPPIMLQARCWAAATLEALGEPARATSKRDEARQTIDEIADLIQDADMRREYTQSSATLLHAPGPATT